MIQRWGDAVIMRNIVGTIIRKSVARADQTPDISAPLTMESLKTNTFTHQPRNDQLVKTTLANGVKRTRFQSFEQCNYSVFVSIMAVP